MKYHSNDINKIEYFDFYQRNALPIYFAPWWQDAVCGADKWDVILHKNDDNLVQGVWIYHQKKKFGLKLILMPPLTAYAGVWLNYPAKLKGHSKIAFEKKIVGKLWEQLPQVSFYFQQFSPQMTNGLPLKWKGFGQTIRYTYILHDIKNQEALWQNAKGSIRTDIRKAKEKISIITTDDFDTYFAALDQSFKSKNKSNPYPTEIFRQLDQQLQDFGNRRIFLGKNKNGTIISGVYLVYNQTSAYYLSGFQNNSLTDVAALTSTLWHGIGEMSHVVDTFDFEGSMIPEIEKFFRAFGGTLTPHAKFFKTSNRWIKLLINLKNPEIFE